MEIKSRDVIVARYRVLRDSNVRHQSEALRLVSKDAMLAQAKRLGVAEGKTIVADEEETYYVFDLSIYTAQPGRTRAIDRLARSRKALTEYDDARVLNAMLEARFSLWQVERKHEVAGLIVQDMIREDHVWLMDEGLEQSAWDGMVIGSRLFQPEPAGFAMTCGVAIHVDKALLTGVVDACGCVGGKTLREAADDRRFATALYRLSIKDGGAEDFAAWAA